MEATKTTPKDKPLSTALKYFFGIGDFGFSMMSSIDTYYATFFFTNVAMFTVPVTTAMTTISAIVDAILSLFYGPTMNKIKPLKWGRYRSWLIILPWAVPFLYAMQFLKVGTGMVTAIVCTLAMITSRIAWNLPWTGNLAMINVAAKTPADRMALSSIRSVWTSLAAVLYSYVGPMIVALFTSSMSPTNAYAATAFAFGCLFVAGYFAHFVMFKGYEMTGAEEMAMYQSQGQDGKAAAPKVKVMKVFFTNSHLIWLFLASISKYVVTFLISGLAVYYFAYVGHNRGLMTSYLFAGNLLAVIASYIAKYVVAKLTAKRTVVICYIMSSICGIGAYLLYQQVTAVIVLMCVSLFFIRMTNACDPELYAKCAALSKKKLGYDVTGTVMGLLPVPLKIGIIARGLLIASVLAASGFDSTIAEDAAPLAMQQGIARGLLLLPALVIIVGIVLLSIGYRVDKEGIE